MLGRGAILDGEGRAWPLNGAQLRWSLGNVGLYSQDLTRLCVYSLGMIVVSENDGLVSVLARPGNVLHIAKMAAVDLAARWSSGLVLVKDISDVGTERDAKLYNVVQGSLSLWQWLGGAANFDFPVALKTTEIDVTSIEDISVVLRLALSLSGQGNPIAAICAADAVSWKFTMTSVGLGNRLVMETVGPGFQAPLDGRIRKCIGRSLEYEGGSGYGAWVAAAMRTALTRRQIVAQCVDGTVDWPAGRWRHTYTSVRMPIRSDDGRQLLLSATRNIRIEPLDCMP